MKRRDFLTGLGALFSGSSLAVAGSVETSEVETASIEGTQGLLDHVSIMRVRSDDVVVFKLSEPTSVYEQDMITRSIRSVLPQANKILIVAPGTGIGVMRPGLAKEFIK